MYRYSWLACMVGVALLLFGLVGIARAHGARIDYSVTPRTVTEVAIRATFESGEPMSNAQVDIYAPDDPASPWQSGTCSEDGTFSFIPDATRPGTWEIIVRQAGHGATAYVTVEASEEQAVTPVQAIAGSSGATPLQNVMMGAAVVWGFVGTALYFSKRRHG